MTPVNTAPPTIDNPTGRSMVLGTALTLPIPTLAVFLRLWGRYRYRKPGSGRPEKTSWVFWSDLTILISWLSLLALSIVLCLGVHWGEGIHMAELTAYQRQRYLQTYWLYSVFYKWGAGISKMATCFLLLAIATPNMRRFNMTCIVLAVYILGYSFSCSVATILQCGPDLRANWDKTLDQSRCFYMPPFWYTHGALNLIAVMATGILPWCLFSEVIFARKYFIAGLMTLLSIGELIPATYRLYGLYKSAHHLNDMSYITTTGIFVSQLEVEFGVTAACIPTVWRIVEEFWVFIARRVFHMEISTTSSSHKGSSWNQSNNTEMNSVSKSKPRGLYAQFDADEDAIRAAEDGESEVGIVRHKDGIGIMVNTTYAISSRSMEEDEREGSNGAVVQSTTVIGHGNGIGKAT